MLRITRGEDSKLTGWFYEIDRGLLGCVLILCVLGLITIISAGAADATRLNDPWFAFIKRAILPYSLGLFSLFFFSMLNKKQITKISFFGVVCGIIAIILTLVMHKGMNGSYRWLFLPGFHFMPSDIMKPFFIITTAWFLSKMNNVYGSDIFRNKEAWQFKPISWGPYLAIFASCVVMMIMQKDLGSSLLYCGVLFAMLWVADFPLKWLPWTGAGFASVGLLCVSFLPQLSHVRNRAQDMFVLDPTSQVGISLRAIRHGGLFGSWDESYVKDKLPEAANDFVYSSFAEDCGAILACCLLLFLLFVFLKLIKHAVYAKDKFVVYALTGIATLFAGHICFNLMTALHLFLNKGMTLPFVSYGGVSFITFCVTFGIALALIREDTWNK